MPIVSISLANSDVELCDCYLSVRSFGVCNVPAIFMFSFFIASLYWNIFVVVS